MGDLVLIVVLAAAIVGLGLLMRRAPSRRRPEARTVELDFDADGVRRRLADGREERARWSRVREVELVLTPVRTADGARSFVLLAEDDETGCLVPLGIDPSWDRALTAGLSRLARFDLADFERRRAAGRSSRRVVWARPDDQLGGTGSAR